MKPVLFKIASKKKCYLICDNLLILDIPFSKMSACVAELRDGKTDRKSLWAKQVFNINEDFCLEYDEDGDQTMVMSQDGAVFVEDGPERAEIAEWLVKQLRHRRFNRFAVSLRKPHMLMRGLATSALVAFLALAAILAVHNHVVQNLLIGQDELTAFMATRIGVHAIGFIALLVIAAIMAHAANGFIHGDTRIIYKKDAFNMEAYRRVKALAKADHKKQPVRVSAISNDGHYAFARTYR